MSEFRAMSPSSVMVTKPTTLEEGVKAREAKMCVVELSIMCPICFVRWRYQSREALTGMRDIAGAVGDPYMGILPAETEAVKMIRVDTSRWGSHALCGTDLARRLAMVTGWKPGQGRIHAVPAWDESLEREMFGRLKNKQNEYHAVARIVGPATGKEELLDEQSEKRQEILGRTNTLISTERCEKLGLRWGGF